MSEFGDISTSQFQDFAKRVGDEVKTKGMLKRASNRMNIVANYAFRQTKMLTPSDTGTLWKSWSRSNVQYANNEIIVKISNDAKYASFVEYGHRTPSKHKKGSRRASSHKQKVPKKHGKSVDGWVEGVHMSKRALARTENNKLNKTMQKELDGYLSKLLGK